METLSDGDVVLRPGTLYGALAVQVDRLRRHADAAETGLRSLHGRLAFALAPLVAAR